MKPGDDANEIILELGDIYTPDAADDAAPSLAEGSDIHSVEGASPITRAVPPEIEAVVLAYLLDLEVPPSIVPNEPAHDSEPVASEGEAKETP